MSNEIDHAPESEATRTVSSSSNESGAPEAAWVSNRQWIRLGLQTAFVAGLGLLSYATGFMDPLLRESPGAVVQASALLLFGVMSHLGVCVAVRYWRLDWETRKGTVPNIVGRAALTIILFVGFAYPLLVFTVFPQFHRMLSNLKSEGIMVSRPGEPGFDGPITVPNIPSNQ